jgi:hypothetical protein
MDGTMETTYHAVFYALRAMHTRTQQITLHMFDNQVQILISLEILVTKRQRQTPMFLQYPKDATWDGLQTQENS